MNILLAGPVEGRLGDLLDFAKEAEAHWVVCAGDFGVWPDPERMDTASRSHASKEFAHRYVGSDSRLITTPVLTLAGVHDDNRWLDNRRSANNTEILNNVHWLAQGYKTTIGFEGPPCRVTGLGRAYSEATYTGQYSKRSHRHYTRHDVERACSSGPTDILVLYEHLDAPGIRNIIFATRPSLIVTVSHKNRKTHRTVQGVDVVTLGRYDTALVKWIEGKIICSFMA